MVRWRHLVKIPRCLLEANAARTYRTHLGIKWLRQIIDFSWKNLAMDVDKIKRVRSSLLDPEGDSEQ